MKWLKSTTSKSWFAEGKLIPSVNAGEYLQLDENEYSKIASKPVIGSLIKAKGIAVYDSEPVELKNSVGSLQSSNSKLEEEVVQLKARIADLEAQLADRPESSQEPGSPQEPIDIEAIKAEAQAEIKAEAVKELQEMQDKLDAKDKEIAALTKKLKKAEKAE